MSFFLFEVFLQIAQRLQAIALIFANPAFVNLVQRHWIEIVQFFASTPDAGHQIGPFQHRQMLGNGLPRHVQLPAQFGQCLPVFSMQLIQQLSPAWVRQRLKHCIHPGYNMQPYGCVSSEKRLKCEMGHMGHLGRMADLTSSLEAEC